MPRTIARSTGRVKAGTLADGTGAAYRAAMTGTDHWRAERYARTARFVAEMAESLVDLLDPRPGERILDLGCGDGALTEKLVGAGARVIGVDASPDMITAACARGLDARVMNGEHLDFARDFDAVMSNAALHWMRHPDAAIAGVARALVPGGRFVAEMGAGDNVASIVAACRAVFGARGHDIDPHMPWYFPTLDDYRARLERHGFVVADIRLFARPTPIPGPLTDWLDTFAGTFLALVPETQRVAVKAEIEDRLRPRLRGEEGCWTLDYVRLRFAARLSM